MKISLCGFIRHQVALLVIITLMFPCNIFTAFAAASSSKTKIKHTQPNYVVPGKRIVLQSQISDPSGIKLVRCYFKAAEEANYVFVKATHVGNTYKVILPALNEKTSALKSFFSRDNPIALKYVFLAVNKKDQIVKTQEFDVPIEFDNKVASPKWQTDKGQDSIKVGVETEKAPDSVVGFGDSLAFDVVESTARFGVVAGIVTGGVYALGGGTSGTAAASGAAVAGSTSSASGTAAASGAAAGAAAGTSGAAATGAATTVVATGAGLSTGALVAIAAGVAVVGGGVAVASGGSKGDQSTPPGPTYKTTGTVSLNGAPLSGVTINVTGNGTSFPTTTNGSGSFSVSNLPNGTYLVKPTSGSYAFNPPDQTITVSNGDATPLTFTATEAGSAHATW
jgi:hypothetical protein